MAELFNDQPVLGVHLVDDGDTMHNGVRTIGIVAAGPGVLFVDNLRSLAVDPLGESAVLHNDQLVLGAVLIEDGRTIYNDQLVIPAHLVSGGDLVKNGDFAEDLEHWSQVAGTDVVISFQSGRMRMVRGSGSVQAYPYQAIATIPGREYRMQGDAFTTAASMRAGTTRGSGNLASGNVSADGSFDETFVALTQITYLSFWPVGENTTSEIDNISVTDTSDE